MARLRRFGFRGALASTLVLGACGDGPTTTLPAGALRNAVAVATYHGDLATIAIGDTEVASIGTLCREGIGPIVFAPDRSRLYAACGDGGILVVNTETGAVLDTIALLANLDMALSPDGSRLYVPRGFDNQSIGRLLVVSTANGEIVDSLLFPLHEPRRVGVGPDGTVYLAFNLLGIVVVPDGSHAPLDTVPPIDVIGPFAFSPDGQRMYAVADGLVVIDTPTMTVLDTLMPGTAVVAFALDPAGGRAYLRESRTLSVVDLADGSVIATIGLDEAPGDVQTIAVTPDGAWVYASGQHDVEVISTATNSVTATIPLGTRNPSWIRINP